MQRPYVFTHFILTLMTLSCGKTEMSSNKPQEPTFPINYSNNEELGSSDAIGNMSERDSDRSSSAKVSSGDKDSIQNKGDTLSGDDTGKISGEMGKNEEGLNKDSTKNPSNEMPPPAKEEKKGEPKEFTEEDVFNALPSGSDQLKVLCARPGQDKVRQVFCAQNPPKIGSLVDLQKALGLGIIDPNRIGRNNNGTGGNAAFTFTTGSSSLVAKFTSSINPRLIMFTPPTGNRNPNLVVIGFLRGEQFAEIIAGDPSTNQLNFFLVRFEQECNARPGGCTPGELLTPGVESNWTKITIYEDTDIQNTIADCKQCHQPGGENTPKMLRMQELRNPWTHFIRDNTNGGRALIADYQAAHGTTETLAGIPAAMITSSDPAKLENLVRDNGFGNQPNEFQTRTIEGEVVQASPGQPANNSVPGTSQTWNTLYQRFVDGEVIPPPYHDVKVTDPNKLAVMTKSYQDFRNGVIQPDKLPDIRKIFPESAMRDLGFMVKAGLTGAQILMNACAQCHNSNLPQNISRAKFNVDLTKMSKEEKEIAIVRLGLSEKDPRRMPPERFRTLTPEEIKLLTEELRK
jgi:hypothetical protein